MKTPRDVLLDMFDDYRAVSAAKNAMRMRAEPRSSYRGWDYGHWYRWVGRRMKDPAGILPTPDECLNDQRLRRQFAVNHWHHWMPTHPFDE